jgi:hypothetical protein
MATAGTPILNEKIISKGHQCKDGCPTEDAMEAVQ